MKRRIYTLRTEEVKENLASFLESLPLDPLIEVIVQEKKKDRTVAQNILYWKWITVIARELGLTKEDQHEDLKKRLLVPIYERDDQGFAEMIQSVRLVYTDGHKVKAKAMEKQIVKMTSTTGATVKQFMEYLNEIEWDMINKGIYLPHKEDEYNYAMGIKDNVPKTRKKKA